MTGGGGRIVMDSSMKGKETREKHEEKEVETKRNHRR